MRTFSNVKHRTSNFEMGKGEPNMATVVDRRYRAGGSRLVALGRAWSRRMKKEECRMKKREWKPRRERPCLGGGLGGPRSGRFKRGLGVVPPSFKARSCPRSPNVEWERTPQSRFIGIPAFGTMRTRRPRENAEGRMENGKAGGKGRRSASVPTLETGIKYLRVFNQI
jgi:hypothetical protein